LSRSGPLRGFAKNLQTSLRSARIFRKNLDNPFQKSSVDGFSHHAARHLFLDTLESGNTTAANGHRPRMPERIYPFCLPPDCHVGIHRCRHFTYHLFNLYLTMNYKVKNEVLTVCEVKINYCPKVKPSERPQIFGPTSIYSLLMENGIFTPETIEHREFFKVLLLNNAKKLLGIVHLSEGSVNQTVVDVRHIMQSAQLTSCWVLCGIKHFYRALIPDGINCNKKTAPQKKN
jgi:hypothetical protein